MSNIQAGVNQLLGLSALAARTSNAYQERAQQRKLQKKEDVLKKAIEQPRQKLSDYISPLMTSPVEDFEGLDFESNIDPHAAQVEELSKQLTDVKQQQFENIPSEEAYRDLSKTKEELQSEVSSYQDVKKDFAKRRELANRQSPEVMQELSEVAQGKLNQKQGFKNFFDELKKESNTPLEQSIAEITRGDKK